MKTTRTSSNLSTFKTPVLYDQAWLLAILAGVAFLLAMIVVLIVGQFTNVSISAWGILGSIAPWYLAIMSGWTIYTQLPMFVAHGRTRKWGFSVWGAIAAVLVPMAAVFMVIGYQLERIVYHFADFSFSIDDNYYFDSPGEVHIIFFQYFVTFAVWTVLGGFVGASLYRSDEIGWLSIPVAIAISSLAGAWDNSGGGLFGFLRRIVPAINHESIWLDLTLAVIAVTVSGYVTWKMVYNMPLRNPS